MSEPTCEDRRSGPFRHKWFVAHGYECPYCEIEYLARELETRQLVENRLRLAWDESDKEAKRLRAALELVESEIHRPISAANMAQEMWHHAKKALGEPKL